MYMLSQFGESETRGEEHKEFKKALWSNSSLNRTSEYKYGMAKLFLTEERANRAYYNQK